MFASVLSRSSWRAAPALVGASLCVAGSIAADATPAHSVSQHREMFRHPRLVPISDLARQDFYDTVRPYPDFPKPGITFQDVFPIFHDPVLTERLVDDLAAFVRSKYGSVDVIVGLDSRGFLIGPMLACKLGVKFVPVRKKGKLPGKCITVGYKKEYGVDEFEVQMDSIKAKDRCFIVDDLLATGGTMSAAVQLIEKAGGQVEAAYTVVELAELNGASTVFAPCFSHLRL